MRIPSNTFYGREYLYKHSKRANSPQLSIDQYGTMTRCVPFIMAALQPIKRFFGSALYRVTVTKCKTEKYPTVIQHIFTDVKSYDNTEYICHTCHVKAMKGKFPGQAVTNKMELYAVPMQLKCLRKLESVLVSQRILFGKIVVMPKGKQRKIYDTVCNILVNCDTLCQSLPRPPESSGIIILKLKTKLKYHGHQYYESVRPAIVHD